MKWQQIGVFWLLVLVVAGCGPGASSATITNRSIADQSQHHATPKPEATAQSVTHRFPDLVTTYRGSVLPSPRGKNGEMRNYYPPAWLVVSEQHVPGMYLSFGSGEYVPDVNSMPVVAVPSGAEPTVVIGAGSIMEFTPTVIDWNKQQGGTYQRLVATPDGNEPTAFTLAPITAATPQRLDVFVQFQNVETVSYGWKVVFQTSQ